MFTDQTFADGLALPKRDGSHCLPPLQQPVVLTSVTRIRHAVYGLYTDLTTPGYGLGWLCEVCDKLKTPLAE